MVRLEAAIQSLDKKNFKAFSPQIKWNYIPEGTKTSEAIVEGFTQTVQIHTTLNLEHRNLWISILIGNPFHGINKKIEDNIVGWLGESLDVIQVATQSFEGLKITVLVLKIESL